MARRCVDVPGSNWQASATVSPLAPVLHACYIQKINDTMSVAAELETNWIVRESTAIVAYQIEIPAAHATFKGEWCGRSRPRLRAAGLHFNLSVLAGSIHD